MKWIHRVFKSRLGWHLCAALLVKVLLLTLLWQHFVKGHQVHVDEAVMAQRLSAQTVPNSTGEKNDRSNGR